MELSAAQRRLAFALVVFALAGLGVYLFTSARHPAASTSAKSAGQPHARQTAPAASPPAASTSPSGSSDTSSAGPSVSSLSHTPDIYQWLPFTKTGLSDAAVVAVKFGDAYGTFSYTQKAAAYVATMQNLITAQLGQQIAAAYSTPGVTTLRKSRKQVSKGAATITSLRAFGPNSLTFVVAVTEQITATRDGGPTTTGYAVTVTGGDTNWQVSDIELASAGNF
jgi:hypothetical protein